MVNEQLVSYFQEWTQKGYSVEQLKAELLNQGYPKKDIDEAALGIGGSPVPPPSINSETNANFQRVGDVERKLSAINPKAGMGELQTGTNDFYILGAEAGAFAGAVQGIIGAVIGTVLTTFVFSTLMAASGGIFGLAGGIVGALGIFVIITSIISGIIGGAIGGAIIGFILAFLWDKLPGRTPFLKSFILSIIILIVTGVLPSIFVASADLLFAGITLSLVTGVIGAAVYALLFDRFIKKPLF
ncbi:MAG: hypothetical protein JW716_05430 [Candidatus Aenigmarchaeota archaeon]|nr:hypothetical protein [Candidatus Aenigmarchaeota archaeon]